MVRPRISIVTISYNQREFLQRNITSVSKQGFADYEHIIVDPGSTDGSRELVASFRDSRILKMFERDNGPADGLNKGFAKATGEVVLYLNSDDELAPGSLSTIDKLHCENPESDIIVGNGWTIDANGLPLKYIPSDRFTPIRHALSVGIVLQQGTSFKRRIFGSGLEFNSANPVCWDAELLYEAHRRGAHFLHVDDVLGYFRLHEATITVGGRHEKLLKCEKTRLRKSALPSVPVPAIEALSRVLRVYKFVRNRFFALTRKPHFPGLVR